MVKQMVLRFLTSAFYWQLFWVPGEGRGKRAEGRGEGMGGEAIGCQRCLKLDLVPVSPLKVLRSRTWWKYCLERDVAGEWEEMVVLNIVRACRWACSVVTVETNL